MAWVGITALSVSVKRSSCEYVNGGMTLVPVCALRRSEPLSPLSGICRPGHVEQKVEDR